MGITRIRANSQVTAGSVEAGNIADGSLIPEDFAIYPLAPTGLTTAERDGMNSPRIGLIIVNLDTGLLNYYNGTEWLELTSAPTMDMNGGTPDENPTIVIDGGTPGTPGTGNIDGGVA